jgi:hypothetical protein
MWNLRRLNAYFKFLEITSHPKNSPTPTHSHLRLLRDFSFMMNRSRISRSHIHCRLLSLGTSSSCPSNSSSFCGRCLRLGVVTGTITFGIFVSLRLRKNKSLDNYTSSFIKIHCSEAYSVLLLNFLHTIWQTMVSPSVLHELFRYPTNAVRHMVQDQSITG